MNGMHTYHTNFRGRKRSEYPFLASNSHHVIAAWVDFQQTNPPTKAQFISKKVQESKSVQGPHLRDDEQCCIGVVWDFKPSNSLEHDVPFWLGEAILVEGNVIFSNWITICLFLGDKKAVEFVIPVPAVEWLSTCVGF